MNLLETPNLRILPYDQADWEYLAKWYYSKKYINFFRHHKKAYTPHEFKNFPQLISSEFFTITHKSTDDICGLVQFTPDSKGNRAFYVGLIIDEKYQGTRLPLEAYICFFDYAFNRLGYKKAILEILESHESLKRIVVENGFLFEGKLIQECFIDGKYENELRYCMFDTFYNKKFKPIYEGYQDE